MTEIQRTEDYSRFKRIDGNRTIKPGHITKLQNSLSAEPELAAANPILINEADEIIDGQHRFEANKRLGYPISFIQIKGLRLHHVQKLNSNTKAWSVEDYTKSFADLGNKNYQKVLEFKKAYRGFSWDFIISTLSGTSRGVNDAYRDGNFKVKNETNARDLLTKLVDIGEFVDGYTKSVFARAYTKIYKLKQYSHKRMLQKAEKYANRMEAFASEPDAAREIEKVYNWQSTSKVRLF